MFWKGFISLFCGFLFLTFDKGSQIFIQKDIDSTVIGKLFLLASIDITATWIATGPWKFFIIYITISTLHVSPPIWHLAGVRHT